MKLNYKNYELQAEGGRFNLYKHVTSTDKKTGKEKPAIKTMGYSYTLINAIKAISHDLCEDNLFDKEELGRYIEAFEGSISLVGKGIAEQLKIINNKQK